jgi:hypothetical protein
MCVYERAYALITDKNRHFVSALRTLVLAIRTKYCKSRRKELIKRRAVQLRFIFIFAAWPMVDSSLG